MQTRMWRNLESLTVAVKEGVKEFQHAAREGVLELQAKQVTANGEHSLEATSWEAGVDEPTSPQSGSPQDGAQREGPEPGVSLVSHVTLLPMEQSAHSQMDQQGKHASIQGNHLDTVTAVPSSTDEGPAAAGYLQEPVHVTGQADRHMSSPSSLGSDGLAGNAHPQLHNGHSQQATRHQQSDLNIMNKVSNASQLVELRNIEDGLSEMDPGDPPDTVTHLAVEAGSAHAHSDAEHSTIDRHSSDGNTSSRGSMTRSHGLGKQVLEAINPGPDSMSQADAQKGYAQMKAAYEEMKALLQKSMQECMRLSDEIMRTESQARSANASAAEHAAAAKAARKEASELAQQLAAAKKEAVSVQRKCEQLKQQLQQLQQQQQTEQGTDTAELELLRNELSSAVRKVAAAVDAREAAEARAQLTESAREAAEAARMEADRLRREAEAAAQAAMAAADAERNTRAEAEGATEALRADQERRARIFNNAVRTAVGKLQRELEAERDALQAELREARQLLSDTRAELRAALAAAEESAVESAAHAADMLAAKDGAAAAEAAAARAATREAEAIASARSAEAARHELAQQLARVQEELTCSQASCSDLDMQVTELRDQLEADRTTFANSFHRLEAQLQEQQDRADRSTQALHSVEKQLETAKAASIEANDRASQISNTLQARVTELEAEVQKLRVAGSTTSGMAALFQLPTTQDVLAGLGLEAIQDQRLRFKSPLDVEAAGVSSTPTSSQKAIKARVMTGAAARVLGVLPMRMLLLVAYLLLLHVAVMVSFTRSTPDLERLCADRAAIGADKLLP